MQIRQTDQATDSLDTFCHSIGEKRYGWHTVRQMEHSRQTGGMDKEKMERQDVQSSREKDG